jgi:hypothetical protein
MSAVPPFRALFDGRLAIRYRQPFYITRYCGLTAHFKMRKTRFFETKQNGLPQDRRLCTDGLIIRAQAMIRADGSRPRQIGEGLRAPRANHVQIFRI